MGRRMIQLGKEIEKDLAQIFEEIDFQPASLVTITEVSLSSLLDQARVSVGVFPSEYGEEVLKKIELVKGQIKKDLAQKIRVKKMPEVNFYLDEGPEKAARIEKILNEIEQKEAR